MIFVFPNGHGTIRPMCMNARLMGGKIKETLIILFGDF